MEELLDLYSRPYQASEPLVCFDERPVQLISETRQPIAACAGAHPQRYDYEYNREGTANLFGFFQPQQGWRHLKVTQQRTSQDFAQCMEDLVDRFYPTADKIHVVLDNLNTHKAASLYKTFPPEKARRLLNRLQFHYTPKHGSWLNMVELEFSVLSRQCLNRRIATMEKLEGEVAAWEVVRNQAKATVNWRFSCTDARVRLERLYPNPTLS